MGIPIFPVLRPVFETHFGCVETHFLGVLRPFEGVETHFFETHFGHVETCGFCGWWLLTGLDGGPFLDSVGGGAWPFLFGDVICLVDHFNDRDFSLLNSVQHDSYLTAFYKDTVCATEGCVRQKRACDAFLCSVFCHCGFL